MAGNVDVRELVDAARLEAQAAVDRFARELEREIVREYPKGANAILNATGSHVGQLAERLAATLANHTGGVPTEEAERLRWRFAREARLALAPLLAYASGHVDASGARSGNPAELARTLAQVWAEPAIGAWFDRMEEDLEAIPMPSVVEKAVALHAAEALRRPAPAKSAPPPLDLGQLLARANDLGIKIKNVPDEPTPKYLEKLAAQLDAIAAKKGHTPAPTPARALTPAERLAALMAWSSELGVKVKSVPDSPTEGWMDKMEAKLDELAQKKGLPKPAALGGPPPAAPPPRSLDVDLSGTPMAADRAAPPPVRLGSATPPGIDLDSLKAALVQKAREAGVPLERVPSAPTLDWLTQTETMVDSAIERKKAERRAERKRKEEERNARVASIRTRAAQLGVDIGSVPPFPTEDWLMRAEQRLQAATLAPTKSAPGSDRARSARLQAVLRAAREAEVDLGEVPPDPDDVWLGWAESTLDKATADSEGAIALLSEHMEEREGVLVWYEGTEHEQVFAVVEEQDLTVGRGKGNTVQVSDDASVSRKHFTIRSQYGRYYLRDEGSTKGTFVAGRAVQGKEVELQGDELVKAGDTQWVFRIRG